MNEEILWRQFSLYVDLYKFYMEIIVKFNLFYYGITGAILSFYFVHANIPLICWSLALPIVMSVFFAAVFIYQAERMRILRDDLYLIRDKLRLETAPDIGVFAIVLRVCAALFVIVAACLGILLWKALAGEIVIPTLGR